MILLAKHFQERFILETQMSIIQKSLVMKNINPEIDFTLSNLKIHIINSFGKKIY